MEVNAEIYMVAVCTMKYMESLFITIKEEKKKFLISLADKEIEN